MTLPSDYDARKALPIFSGVLRYFPDAIAAVAHCSKVGNDQHNPGEPLHWAREKSTDEHNTCVRHLLEAGTFDTDGVRHSAKAAWRALAALQKEIEADGGALFDPNYLPPVLRPAPIPEPERHTRKVEQKTCGAKIDGAGPCVDAPGHTGSHFDASGTLFVTEPAPCRSEGRTLSADRYVPANPETGDRARIVAELAVEDLGTETAPAPFAPKLCGRCLAKKDFAKRAGHNTFTMCASCRSGNGLSFSSMLI